MRRAGEPEKRRGGGGGALTVARAEHGCFLGNEGRGCGCCGGDFLVLLLLLLLLLPLPSSASAESPAGRVAQCRRLGSEEDRAACGGRSAATSRGGERGIRRRWRRRLGGDGKETGERRRREAEAERGKKRRYIYTDADLFRVAWLQRSTSRAFASSASAPAWNFRQLLWAQIEFHLLLRPARVEFTPTCWARLEFPPT